MQNPSDWELLDDGYWNGVRKWIRGSEEEHGSVQVRYEGVGDECPIVEENKKAEAPDKRGDMWHVGHVPASVAMKWLVEEGLDLWNPDHRPGIMRKLMDSDYRHLVPGLARIIM